MTKFKIIDNKNQIIVNKLKLNRDNVVSFLSKLIKSFNYPSSFTINDIKNRINTNYSDKTIRAMVFIYNSMNFIEIIPNKSKRTKFYRFKKEMSLLDMINHLYKMG